MTIVAHAVKARVREAHRLYLTGKTMKEVAASMGLKSATTLLYHFQRAGLPTRPRGGSVKGAQAGARNGNWKGGIIAKPGRHVRVWMPEHPDADSLGYVYQHRLTAEKALGRRLKRREVVHHIDGNKHNNDNGNLLVCTQAYHAWLHQQVARRAS